MTADGVGILRAEVAQLPAQILGGLTRRQAGDGAGVGHGAVGIIHEALRVVHPDGDGAGQEDHLRVEGNAAGTEVLGAFLDLQDHSVLVHVNGRGGGVVGIAIDARDELVQDAQLDIRIRIGVDQLRRDGLGSAVVDQIAAGGIGDVEVTGLRSLLADRPR